MMKRRFLAVLFLLLAALAACTLPRHNSQSELQLYYTSTQEQGPSILSQPSQLDKTASPEELILALLAGPTQPELRSPFPAGLALRSCTLENGLLTVDFSEQYDRLVNLPLTLADYCLVLTVCQLEGVDQVAVTCAGAPLSHRSHQILSHQDVLLTLTPS